MSLKIASARRRSLTATLCAAAVSAMILSGCGAAGIFAGFSESAMGVNASPRVSNAKHPPKGGGRYQVGDPYTVAGNTFVPREQPNLDTTGTASWYGPAFHGRLTANGEIFDQHHLSGAHPTLPLPSYVRVTNLANGANTLVRINDRGPFSRDRLIDVSRRTAEVLGFQQQGTANVRVQYVGPAPLEGDDTRFLVASINQLTPYEMNTRMAYQEVQVADATPATTSVAPVPMARPEIFSDAAATTDPAPANLPFQLLSYSAGLSAEPVQEPTGTPIRMALGTFSSDAEAREVATRFALLGAVDTTTFVDGEQTVTHLMLSYLREGVTETDAMNMAASLGLSPTILY